MLQKPGRQGFVVPHVIRIFDILSITTIDGESYQNSVAKATCFILVFAKAMDALRKTLCSFREHELLCDVTIHSRDSEHLAHRVVLAAASNYFRTLFLSDFMEAQSGVIKLKDIGSDLMADLLEHIYSGSIDINEANGLELFCIADRFEVIGLKKSCEDFLLKTIDKSNCLNILRLGQSVNEGSLEKTAFGFIVENFQDFISTDDFYDLTIDEFTAIIRQSNLYIEREEELYEAVLSWADKSPKERNEALPNILENVRFPLMSLDYLESNVINSDRVGTEKWNDTIFDVYHRTYHYMKHDKRDAFFMAPSNMPCYSLQLRPPSQLICVMGGWSNGRCLQVTECYNPKSNEWSVTAKFKDPFGSRCYYGSTVIEKKIYYAGGYDGGSYLNTIRCFDPSTKTWREGAPMYSKRCFTNLVNYQSNIYAIAGFDGMKRLSSVERYSPDSNQWTRVASLGAARSDCSAVVCGGFIYVIGGYSGDSLRSVEYYDGEIWRYAAPMNTKRSGVSAVKLPDDRVFVIGGYDGALRQKTTEFYNPQTNSWIYGPSMDVARSNFATCLIREHVYVIGGYTGEKTLRDVERYNIANNTWTTIGKLNFARSAITAIVLTGVQNIEDYISALTQSDNSDGRSCTRHLQNEFSVERLLSRN